jgi:hypothetical protein
MNERRLRRALDEAAPVDSAAQERAWRIVEAAYGEHVPSRPRRPWRAALLATGLAGIAALGATAAAAPDSGVGHFVRSVFGIGQPGAHPALVTVPGGGRLLVQAAGSTWVVASDGARRRLGAYAGASWSPQGRFVIAWSGGELTAMTATGDVRWSLARPDAVRAARWGPVDGFRVAYLAGAGLRVVNGDGTGDRFYGPARTDVAPAWRPDDKHVLAYVDRAGRVDVVAVDTGARVWRSPPVANITQLLWSANGERLLALTPRRLVLWDRSGLLVAASTAPAGALAGGAAWAPRGLRFAVVRSYSQRSQVVLLDAGRKLFEMPLFSAPGRLGPPAWSPDGQRVLVPWPQADQWLFLRPDGQAPVAAVAHIARQFSPGVARPASPAAVAWCCG